ncbi:MAG: SNF2-related protein [Saprospiraceae bacterium]
MEVLLVYNLYPFSDFIYLPSANIISLDTSGQLAHVLQKATPATLLPYGIEPTELEQSLLDLIEVLNPKAIESHFKPKKVKRITSLENLLANRDTKSSVEAYIFRHLSAFLEKVHASNFPLTLDVGKKMLAKDVQLAFPDGDLLPHLHFKKTDAGMEYRLRLGTESEQWKISDYEVVPLTNTDPAWILVDYTLFRVVGINGNMVRPFRQKEVVEIPPDKVRTYFQTFISKALKKSSIEAEGFEVHRSSELEGIRLRLKEHLLEKDWLFQLDFEYGGRSFFAGEKQDKITSITFPGEEVEVHQLCRDFEKEAEYIQSLEKLGLRFTGTSFRAPETLDLQGGVRWLIEHEKQLKALGIEIEMPVLEGRELYMAEGKIQLDARSEGDWFDVHGQVQIGTFEFPFKAFVPFLKSRDPYFPLPNGTHFLIPDEWFARYSDLAGSLQNGPNDTLQIPKPLFTVLEAAGLAEGDAGFPVIDPDQIDYVPGPELKASLRPYQLRGVRWLVGHYHHGFGACLADDMGLGKTLQTIAALLYVKSQRTANSESGNGQAQLDLFASYEAELAPLRALIILPASLVFNWSKELQRFAPSLFINAHVGPRRLKEGRALSAHDVVLTTYHTARQDLQLLESIKWNVIVLDESQQIKNRDSGVSKVVRSLDADFKVSLSGTPIENSLSDLWTQMDFINPSTLGTYPDFKEQFQIPIEKQQDADAAERLNARVQPFFLRRTKEAVAPDLPGLTEQIFYTEMAPAQKKHYEQVKSAVRNQILSLFEDPKTRLMALQALMQLRQISNHPVLVNPEYTGGSGKFEDVLAQWDVVQRAGHKALFFSSFEKHLQLFRSQFETDKSPYAWLTGGTASKDRAGVVQAFQDQSEVQAFFMTIKAGGVGLNLTAADYVFILDPWWNPAIEAQAIARAHRIGQTQPVTAIRFISRDTIEEKILVLQEKKRALGELLFEPGSQSPRLSQDDMEQLLG